MSSFQKTSASKIPYIPGTKPSIRNNQLLTTTGVPELDVLLGGGLPVGSILLVEQTEPCIYGSYLEKYLLAEGIYNQHSLIYAKPDKTANQIFDNLPAESTVENVSDISLQDPMKIAWRYETLPQVDSRIGGKQSGRMYDLGMKMSSDLLQKCNKTVLSDQCSYPNVTNALKNFAQSSVFASDDSPFLEESLETDSKPKKNLLRVVLSDFGSPLWGDMNDCVSSLNFCQFLLRESYAICLVTMPVDIMPNDQIERIRDISDAVIRLEAFEGTNKESNPVLNEYHGQLHIIKLPITNSLIAPLPESLDLGFKLNRKRFLIEKLHLPPVFGDSSDNTAATCGVGGKMLDF